MSTAWLVVMSIAGCVACYGIVGVSMYAGYKIGVRQERSRWQFWRAVGAIRRNDHHAPKE